MFTKIMKKLFTNLMSLALIFFTVQAANAQYVVKVNSPSALAGKYTNTSTDWGANKMAVGTVVTANVAIVNAGIDPVNDSINAEGCDTLVNSAAVSGKIAFIRRGGTNCEFGFKSLMAQNAGAVAVVIINRVPGAPIAMGAGAVGAQVTIPVVQISLEDGQLLIAAIKSGATLNMTITVPTFSNPRAAYSYFTPIGQTDTLGGVRVNVANPTPNDFIDVTATATITDPNGVKTVLTATKAVIPSLQDSIMVFPATFKPSANGLYKVAYTTSTQPDTLRSEFKVGGYSYAHDNGVVTGFVVPSAAQFETANYRYDAGSIFIGGADGIATGATFGIGNVVDIPDGETFQIRLYDMDPDGDGSIGFVGTNTTYDGYTILGGIDWTKTSADNNNNALIDVVFDEPVPITRNGQYMVVVKYDGGTTGSIIAPAYSSAQTFESNYYAHLLVLDAFYTGWSGSSNAIVRMNMEGFVTANEEVVKAETLKMTVQPNPATNFVAVSYELPTAGNVELTLFSVNGQAVKSLKESNRMDAGLHTATFDVSDLAKGVYFVKINNNNKVAVKKVVVQ